MVLAGGAAKSGGVPGVHSRWFVVKRGCSGGFAVGFEKIMPFRGVPAVFCLGNARVTFEKIFKKKTD